MANAAWKPAWDGYLADPFVWKTDDWYYAIGTGGPEAVGDAGGASSEGWAVPILRSRDLTDWEPLGRALEYPGEDLGREVWAPAVAEQNGIFYLYYSIGDCKMGINHQLRVATSDRPEGPYTDSGQPLLLPGEETFVFDPHPLRDPYGNWYLFYNRNYFDQTPQGRAGDAISARRLETMTRVAKEAVAIVRPWADWQRGPLRQHNGVPIDWHTNEGACVVYRNGRYYCFYSGSAWFTDKYGVDYVVADAALGPYRSDNPNDAPRVLQAIPGVLRGPGHNSLVVGPDGVTDYIVFHAWDEAMKNRQMHIEPLVWTPDGPRLRRFASGG